MIVTNSGYAYYTLNELYLKNSAINTIFDDVQSIFQPDSPVQKSMFFMFKMHFGACHINQPKGNDVIGIDDVLEIKQKVYLHYLENKYKYDSLIASENFEYNPIENYDLTEHEESTRTPDLSDETTYNTTQERTPDLEHEITYNTEDKRTANLNDKTTYNSTDTRTPNTTETTNNEFKPYVKYQTVDNGEDVNSVSAYDTNAFTNNTKLEKDNTRTVTPILTTINNTPTGDKTNTTTTNTGTDTNKKTGSDEIDHTGTDTNKKTGTETTTDTGTDTTTHTGSDTTTHTGTDTNERDLTRHGNIGVMSTQQMIEQERSIADFSAVSIFFNGVKDILCLIY